MLTSTVAALHQTTRCQLSILQYICEQTWVKYLNDNNLKFNLNWFKKIFKSIVEQCISVFYLSKKPQLPIKQSTNFGQTKMS